MGILDDGSMELIKKLYEGKMDLHPRVRFLIDKAIITGDSRPLRVFLQRYKAIEAAAERNIALKGYQQLDNPFMPCPSRDEARLYLNRGFARLGYVNGFDDMFSVHPDLFCTHVMNAGGIGTGKSALTKYVVVQLVNEPGLHHVLIADLKREYRNLVPLCPSLRVLRSNFLQVNPWQVPEFRTPQDHIFATAKVWINIRIGFAERSILRTKDQVSSFPNSTEGALKGSIGLGVRSATLQGFLNFTSTIFVTLSVPI